LESNRPKTIIWELNEAARVCPKPDEARMLKAMADEIRALVRTMAYNPTNENLRDLIGVWTNAYYALQSATPPVPPPEPPHIEVQLKKAA